MGWRQEIPNARERCPHCGEILEYVLVQKEVLEWQEWTAIPEDNMMREEELLNEEELDTHFLEYRCPFCDASLTREEVKEIFGVEHV